MKFTIKIPKETHIMTIFAFLELGIRNIFTE